MKKEDYTAAMPTRSGLLASAFTVLACLVLGIQANAQCIIGTGTSTTNGGSTGNTTADPVERYYNFEHFQMVYTAAELSAGGMTAGSTITAMGFSISESASSLANYTISMGHTAQTTGSPYISTGLSIVKTPFTYSPVVQTAGNFDMITLTTPFIWNGTSNIVVNTCTGSNPFTSPYGGLRYTTTTNNTYYIRTDGVTDNCPTATNTVTSNRPNIRFNFTAGSPCSGTPAPGNTTLLSGTNPTCAGTSVTLGLQNATPGSGVTYQWQSSPNGSSWTNISGATSNTVVATLSGSSTFYRCNVICAGNTGTSNPLQVVVNCVNMQNGSATNCALNFFDSGGSGGSYANNETFTYTFFPVVGTDKVRAVFSAFSTENNYDGLRIYNGPNATFPLLSSGLPVGSNATTAPAGSYYGTVSPGTVTSTDASGALTFVFASDGSGTATGWAAAISCISACTGTPAPGNTVLTAGTNSTCSGTSVTLGLQNAINGSGVTYQWQSSPDGTTWTNISGATATTVVATLSGSSTFYRCNVTCAGNTGTSTPLQVVVNCVNMGNGTSTNCALNFFDSGGSGGNYANSETFTYTFFPVVGTDKVRAIFSAFSTENLYDGLRIYNGPNATFPLLSSGLGVGNNATTAPAGSYYGTTSPGTVTSSDPSGALTFVFASDGSNVSSGWAAAITCVSVCTGTPAPGNTVLTAGTNPTCPSTSFTLGLQNSTPGGGITYQWQSSPDGSSWTNVSGATSATLTTTAATSTYYRCNVTCQGNTGTSTPLQVVVNCVNMTNGSSTNCALNFFDSGGSGGNYANNETFTYTFFPVVGTDKIRAVFSAFSTENLYDGLRIYNGPNTTYPLISSGLPVGNNTTTAPAGSYYGTTSPGTVTSTDASGALTFVFASDISNVSTGWAAAISCITVPPCSGTPTPGNTLLTVGTNPTCAGTSVSLGLQNSTSGTGVTYQWQSSPDGSTWTNISGATFTTLTTTVTGTTYYRAVVTCATGGAGTSTPIQIQVNCANMTNGSTTTCSLNFFDSGGSTGSYANNETFTYTIFPATSGSAIRAIFSAFATESGYDGLLIYNGPNTSSPLISSGLPAGTNATTAPAGSYYGTTSPGTVTSTNPSGALTFVFNSDFSNVAAGWVAAISCVTLCPPPAVPTFVSGNVTICGLGDATATVAPGAGGATVDWYAAATGGTALLTNAPSIVVTFNTTTTVTYYAQSVAACGTGSTTRLPVVFTANPYPTLGTTTASPGTICLGASTNLVYTSPPACGVQAGFAGVYFPANWTFTQSNADGSVNASGAPANIVMTSGDNGSFVDGQTNFSITIPCTGTVTFNWSYSTGDDPLYDQPQYSINGGTAINFPGFSTSGSLNQSGTASIAVTAGQTFTLIANTEDNFGGPATITISNFSGPSVSSTNHTIVWFDAATGGNVVGSGPTSTQTPGTSGTVTYYAQVTDAGTGCTNPTRIATQVVVNPLPTVTCPANVTVSNDPGLCAATVNYGAATATGTPAPTVTYSQASGSSFAVGVSTVTATASNVCGTATCSFTVTVVDNEAPVVTCPQDISVGTDPGQCSAAVSYTVTATDNCAATVSSTPASGSVFGLGSTLVTATATDPSGNASTCSFFVTVSDNENPVVTCPANITVNSAPGQCGAAVTYTATATDNCSAVVFTMPASGSTFPVGTTVVEATATDPTENSATCSFTVTVVDNENPVIVCPANISVSAASGQCAQVVSYAAPVGTDNCGGATTAQTAGLGSGLSFPVGVTTNAFQVTDASLHTATCSFTVTVTDNQAPVISCPPNQTVCAFNGGNSAVVTYNDATATDNCPGVTVVRTGGPASGSSFPVGNTVVTYRATDASGNTSTCSFTVTVNTFSANSQVFAERIGAVSATTAITAYETANGFDNDNLTMSGNGDIRNTAPSSTIYYGGASGTGNVFLTNNTTAPAGNRTFEIAGINASNFTGMFLAWGGQKGGTGANLATGAELQLAYSIDNGATYTTVNHTPLPGSTGVSPAWSTMSTLAPLPANASVSNLRLRFTNTHATVQFRLDDIILVGTTNAATITHTGTTSFCQGGSVNLVASLATSYLWSTGETTQNIVVTTPGNYSVTVTGSNGCQAIAGPVAVSVYPQPTVSATSVNASCPGGTNGSATALPSGGTSPYSYLWTPGNQTGITATGLGAGTYSVQLTDANGCTATSNTVTVTDNDIVAPVAVCTSFTTSLNSGGTATITAANVDGGSTDNCSIVSRAVSPNSFTCANVGANSVILTVTDVGGNTATCSATVTVQDLVAPTAVCQNLTVNLDGSGNVSVTASQVNNGSTDNCGIASLAVTPNTFNCADVQGDPVGLFISEYLEGSGNNKAIEIYNGTGAAVNLGAGGYAIATYSNGSTGISSSIALTGTVAAGDVYVLRHGAAVNSGIVAAADQATSSGLGWFNGDDAVVLVKNSTVIDIVGQIGCQPNATWDLGGNQTMDRTLVRRSFVTSGVSVNPTGPCGTGSFATLGSQWTGFPQDNTANLGSHSFIARTNGVTLTVTDVNGNTASCGASVVVNDVTAPNAVCQDLTLQLDGSGNASTTAAAVNNGSTDACGIASLSLSATAFTCANTGNNTVTLTVTDVNGNAANCTASVTVQDVTAPVITCPASFSQNTDPGQCNAVVSFSVTATDNCSATVTSSPASGSVFTVGTHPVTATATDPSGNSVSCSFTVTVSDNENPTITCPANITASNDPGQCSAVVSYAVSSSDNCGSMVTSSPASGSSFAVGITTVNATAADFFGNTAVCSFTVTVTDDENPVITCPANITVSNDAGQCSAVVSFGVTATDNCGAMVTSNPASGSVFNVGTTVVNATASDSTGNTADCSFSVTVTDDEAPQAVCTDVTVVLGTDDLAHVAPGDVDAGSSDNCIIDHLSLSIEEFSCQNVGQTTVVLSVYDANGNVGTCSATVTTLDQTAPVAVCQDITVALDANGAASIQDADIDGGSTDNCQLDAVQASVLAFDCGDLGANAVVLTVTDGSGNTAACTATVTVEDNLDPAIVCPANITISHDPNACGAVVNYATPTGTDNCSVATVSLNSGLASGSLFPIGSTTVTWTATDGSGNTAACSFDVNVSGVIVTANDFVTVGDANNTGGNCFQITPAQNNRFGAIWYQNMLTLGSDFSLEFDLNFGTNDANGADGLAFVLQPVNTGQGSNGGGIGYLGITPSLDVEFDTWQNTQNNDPAADHIGINKHGNTSHASGALVAPVTLPNIEDGANHSARLVWDATATKLDVYFDNVLRTSLTQDITTTLFGGSPFVYWGWTGATGGSVNDQRVCVGDLAFSEAFLVSTGTSSPETCPGAANGSVNVTVIGGVPPYTYLWSNGATTEDLVNVSAGNYCLTVTDHCGNTATTCVSVALIPDVTAPVITCPANITTSNNPGECQREVSYNVTATDNCTLQGIVTTPASGNGFPVGTTTVTSVATDASGNSSSCTFTVTVNDTQAPVITCPANVGVAGNTGSFPCTGTATYTAPVGTDNCAGATTVLTAGLASGSSFPQGSNTVTFTVTDASGNTASCSFMVTVGSCNRPPVAVCQNITVNANANCQGTATAAQFNGGSSDPDGNALTYSVSPAGPYALGTTTVILTVSDGQLTSTCTATVTVRDVTPPAITCPANRSVVAGTNCTAVVTYPIATATDNCGSTTVVRISGPASGATFPVGVTTVVFRATDLAGNSSTCSFTVTVTSAPMTVALTSPLNGCGYNVSACCNSGNGGGSGGSGSGHGDHGSGSGSGSGHHNNWCSDRTCYNFGQSNNFCGHGSLHGSICGNGNGSHNHGSCCGRNCNHSHLSCNHCGHTHGNCGQGHGHGGGGGGNLPPCGHDGSATATVTGGCAPYTYHWSTGATTATITGLTPGLYVVTVTDAGGHTTVQNIVLTQASALALTATGTNVSCYGSHNGTATATATGGCAPYTYTWSNGSHAGTISNLNPGTYRVTVTDGKGCTATAQVTVTQPGRVVADAGAHQVVYPAYAPRACATLNGTATGGTPGYTYRWTRGGSATVLGTSANLSVCPTVTTVYYLLVTDSKGCTGLDSVAVCPRNVSCGSNMIQVCHNAPGHYGSSQTLCVSTNNVASHLNHGDQLGACGSTANCNFPRTNQGGGYCGPNKGAEAQPGTMVEPREISMRAFPNPTNGNVTVEMACRNCVEDGVYTLKISDIYGQEILLSDVPVIAGEGTIQLDLGKYSAGVYLITVTDGDTRLVERIVKQ